MMDTTAITRRDTDQGPLDARRERVLSGAPADWEHYARSVRGHRRAIILVTIVGTLLGMLFAQRIEPEYESRAILWIERTDATVEGRGGGADGMHPIDASGWRDLLTSHAVLDSVVRTLGLAAPPERAESTEVKSPAAVEAELARDIHISVDPAARFVRVSLRDRDADRAAAILNAVATRAITLAATLERQRLEELDRILGERYRHAERVLRTAEQSAADFRTREIAQLERSRAGSTPSGESAVASVAELSGELDGIRRDRARLTALVRRGDAAVALDAFAAMPIVEHSPQLRLAIEEAMRRDAELRTLRLNYTEESAPVRAATMARDSLTSRTIPALARTLIAELDARDAMLAPRVDSAFRHLRRVPGAAIADARVARQLVGAEDMFARVGERYEVNRLALVSTIPALHILDEARPAQEPTRDLAALVVALAFMTSLGAGVVGARLRDALDSRVRRPEQVTDDMRLTILGCVPRIGWHARGAAAVAAEEAIEALRGLRVRLLQARSRGSLCLTVTSPASGEGKSFLSVNLALSFAQAGYRTVLVDGDVRRGVQHRVLGASPRPGLVEVLAGEVSIADAVQPTEHPGLSLVSSGQRALRAPELLMSPRLAEVIERLKAEHDVILVDSPPLTAGVDALVLGAATTNLVVVLRSGTSELALTRAVLQATEAHPVRLVGAILNDVRDESEFRPYAYELGSYRTEALNGSGDRIRPTILGGRP